MTSHSAENKQPAAKRSRFATFIRLFAAPVILGWVVLTVILNIISPQLEVVGRENSVSLASKDAPSYKAIKRQGKVFHQFDSDSMVMIVLEGQQPLSDDAHKFYSQIIAKLRKDTKHVEYIQDFWSDRITSAGAQSSDGKAAYVQLNLHGDMGTVEATDSIDSVSKIVKDTPAPPGVKAYVTGQAALTKDMNEAGDKSMTKMTLITLGVILVMLLIVYRRITTMLLIMFLVFLELGASRGFVALLGEHHIIGLSTFATSLLTSLAIAAGTDYAIFFIGRYHEARAEGHERLDAYYETYHSVSHVILGSGLTIAGATLCLKFTRLPYFESLGVPCAIGMLVVVSAALTLSPAIIILATKVGLIESKRKKRAFGWRRLGTAIVRWPAPVFAVTMIIALLGLAILPSYKVNYDDRDYIPQTMSSTMGYKAAERHFSKARMNPDILIVETDQDLRTSAGMLVLDRIAKYIFRLDGIAKVQSITRPLGSPIDHSSIPFVVGNGSVSTRQNMDYLKTSIADMKHLAQVDLDTMIGTMEKMYSVTKALAGTTHNMRLDLDAMQGTVDDLRDHLADFDDQFRPLRNYFYWEPHCFDIPMCWGLRSIFDALDGVDKLSEQFNTTTQDLHHLDELMPQLVALLPPMIAVTKSMQQTMLKMSSTMQGMVDGMDRMTDTSTVMGMAFDEAKNDDYFYLPPEAFENPDFQRGVKLMMSPDAKAAEIIITHAGDPASSEALAVTQQELNAAQQAIKGTPLEGSKIYLGGTAPTYHDIGVAVKYDMMIAVISSMSLILLIMLILTRSLVAALIIVGTIGISLGSSFGLTVLIWQYVVGLELHWFVLPFTLIILLAVGSDYNLLLVSRFKEELERGAGMHLAIIRGVGGSGGVLTSAGLVFAFTMGSMITSDLIAIGQAGSAICLGLLFDTFVIRGFMTPAVATLLGRWFWWPINVFKLRKKPPASAVMAHSGSGYPDDPTGPLPKPQH